MKEQPETAMNQALDWCASVMGPVAVLSDYSKVHGGHESAVCHLRTSIGFCYLKVHQTLTHWHSEIHAYERWVRAFGHFAPTLLAVRDEAPPGERRARPWSPFTNWGWVSALARACEMERV